MARLTSSPHETNGEDQAFTSSPQALEGNIFPEETRRQYRFQSFESDSLARFKELAPQVPRLLLIDEVMIAKDGWDAVLKVAAQVGMGIGTWGYRWAYGPDRSITGTGPCTCPSAPGLAEASGPWK